jgi:hypothetical protein
MAKRAASARKGRGTNKKKTVRKRAGGFLVFGLVVDKTTGAPIDNADVRILTLSRLTHTNRFGFYGFANVPAGRQLMEASKPPRFQEKDKTITGHTIVNFKL